MRKLQIFVLGLLACTITPARAFQVDEVLNKCLEYVSLAMRVAYYNPTIGESETIRACKEAIPEIGLGDHGNALASAGYYLGIDLQYLVEYNTDKKENIIRNYAGKAVKSCGDYGYIAIETTRNTEYVDYIIDMDTAARTFLIQMQYLDCPDGGIHDDHKSGIKGCYIITFDDEVGSGIYQDGCYYTQ